MKDSGGDASRFHRMAFNLAALAVEISLIRLKIAVKAGFRANQPRISAGRPHGACWTDGLLPVSSRGPRSTPPRRVMGRWTNVTPGQEARLAVSRGEMQAALRAVRKLNRRWKPMPQAYETIEGEIAANNAVAREARIHIFQFTRSPPTGGPYAAEWIPAPSGRRLSKAEQEEINRIGRTYGCHWCGSKDSKTRLGNFIGDHQTPSALGIPRRLYPHCRTCSNSQGGIVRSRKGVIRNGDSD